jgi:hypothetical protein
MWKTDNPLWIGCENSRPDQDGIPESPDQLHINESGMRIDMASAENQFF